MAGGSDDQALVQGCLDGDEASWNALVDRYGRLVYSIPRRLGLSDNDADDVFQIVFGIVIRHLEQLRDTERVSAWLIRTAYRESWRLGKRRKRHAAAELDPASPAEDAPPESSASTWERQHLVRQGLVRLDGRCRALLEALFFAAAPTDYRSIAGELGMEIGSIGPTRARCFKKLERILAELGLGPDEFLTDSR